MTGRRVAGKFTARFALAVIVAVAGASVHAQDVPQTISPLRVDTDHNGVNLINGRTRIELPVLSVPGAPNLRFDRVQNAAPYFSGRVQTAAPEGGTATASYSVHTGQGSSESFQCIDFDCTSVTGTGSTFAANTFRQAGSGAVWRFTRKHVDTIGTTPRVQQFYVSSVTWPNGEVISYAYDTATLPGDTTRTFYRPTRLTSNHGYYIEISYQAGAFPDPGWSTVRQAALYRGGAPPILLRRFVYLGGTIIDYGDNATDVGGRTYSCTGCNNALGSDIETWSGSLTLPNEGSPTLQAASVAGATVVGTVTRDGVQWTYSYGGLRPDPYHPGNHLYDNLTVTGPNGFQQAYAMRISDRRLVINQMTDSIGRITDLDFDAAYRPTRMVYPDGNQVSVVYDAVFGNVVSRTTTPKSGFGQSAVTETAFYPTDTCISAGTPILCYRPVWYRDALNRQTDFAYNTSGQLTEQTDPPDANGVRRRTIIEYETSPAGIRRRRVVRVCGTGAACGTASEIRTEYTYWNDTLLPLTETRVSGTTRLTTTYEYDNSGRVTMIDGPLNGTDDATFYDYDDYGRRTREIGPRGANGVRLTQQHTYRNSDDKVTRTQTGTLSTENDTTLDVLSWVDHGYDSRRNPNRETVRATVNGSTVTYAVLQRTFQESGRLECEARRMNPSAFTSLPASACDLGPQGTGTNNHGPDRITRNIYDAAGQLLQELRAYRITTANGFPATLQQIYATYTYGDNGQRTSVTDANGNRAELRYDGFDRLRSWVFPSPTDGGVNEDDYEAYGYDAVGNRTSFRRRDGSTITFTYDALNRVTRKTVPERAGLSATHTRDVYFGYNVRDLQTYARFDSATGEGVTNGYDGFGRLTSTTLLMDNVSRRLDFAYDPAGNRTRITHPGGQAYTYDYDAASRLENLYEGTGTSVLLDHFEYTPRGSVDRRAGGVASSVDYGYDPIGRLNSQTDAFVGGTGDVALGFGHNPASQMTRRTRSNDSYAWTGGYDVSRSYTANGLNQYRTAGPATFAYDANGNLASDGSTAFTYDGENRLVAASGAHTAALRYDPLGRLYEVTGASGTRRFLYDGDALVAEYTSADTLAARFVHGSNAGVDDPLIWYGGGENRRLHADHQGSIVAITYGTGAVRWTNGYDEWGIPNATNVGRFQYTGQAWIGELGMYHYKARVYSPTLGRFLQTDPIGYEGGINLYGYVSNDPVNAVDPTGLADVNYMTESDEPFHQLMGRTYDIPGTVTVMSHGSPISQRVGDDFPTIPTARVAARINQEIRVSNHTRIMLLGCRLASDPAGRNQVRELSRLTGGRPILAATTQTYFSRHNGYLLVHAYQRQSNGRRDYNRPGRFVVVNGSYSDFGINMPQGFTLRGFMTNERTGETHALIEGAEIGSRIPRMRQILVDDQRTGGQ